MHIIYRYIYECIIHMNIIYICEYYIYMNIYISMNIYLYVYLSFLSLYGSMDLSIFPVFLSFVLCVYLHMYHIMDRMDTRG